MTEEAQTERRSRRGGGRDARRATRAASSTKSAPLYYPEYSGYGYSL